MDFDSFVHVVGIVFQVFLLDVLLSGDNALVIALACRSLPNQLRGRAVMLGTVFAIGLRVLLTGVVGFLLQVPFLKLLGAVMLLVIAIKLLLQEQSSTSVDENAQAVAVENRLMSAVMVVVSADLALSLDNVVALAAAAQGSVLFLALGLLLSVPLLMYGSLFMTRLLDEYPLLIPAGSALLGWVAGQIAVSDPILADWVNTQAPALTVVIPMLSMVFVLVESRIIQRQSQQLVAPPPLRPFGWLGARLANLGEAEVARVAVEQPASAASVVASPITAAPVFPQGKPEGAIGSEPEDVFAPQARFVAERPIVATQASAKVESRMAHTIVSEAKIDPVQKSKTLSIVVKVLMLLVMVIGVTSFGWLVLHLASQGFLPQPEHPHH